MGIFIRALTAALFVTVIEQGARADNIGSKFASDEAVKDHVLALLDKDVHFTLSLGIWAAFLSQGPLASLITTHEFDNKPQSPDQAAKRIGVGRGLLRDVTLSLAYKGNEAYFRYLSDQLFQAGEDELGNRIPNSEVRSVIKQIAGELRPDLSKYLGDDARAYGRVTYGDLRGGIDQAYLFASRNGVPYFAGRDAEWRTKYLSIEAGVAPRGELTYFGRFTSFQRPVVLSSPAGEGFTLQDGAVAVYGVGVRYTDQYCGSVACLQIDGGTVPFLGYATLDLGRWGKATGLPLVGSGEARVLFPAKIGPIPVAPYLSLRAEWFLLAVSSGSPTDLSKPFFFAPDYLLWGPLLGLSAEL